MPNHASAERRRHPRIGIVVSVRLTWPLHGTLLLKTRDISDGGVFLEKGTDPLPPIGAIVELQTTDTLGDDQKAPIIPAEVVRITAGGMGLRFLS